jgi:hypothetical protein
VVGFHALEGVDKETSALDVERTRRSDDVTLDLAAGPEGVSHCAPWLLGVGTEVGGAVVANDKTGSSLSELEVDDALLVGVGSDVVFVALLVELGGAALCAEVELALVEAVVLKSVRGPQVGCLGVGVEDLCVELRCDFDAAATCQMMQRLDSGCRLTQRCCR